MGIKIYNIVLLHIYIHIAESMEVASKYNPKTLLDENGHYPEWMNKRRMHKLRDQRKKSKKKGKSNPKW